MICKPGQDSLDKTKRTGGQNMTGRTGHLGQDNQDRIAIRGQPRQSVSTGLPVKVRLKVNPDDHAKCKGKVIFQPEDNIFVIIKTDDIICIIIQTDDNTKCEGKVIITQPVNNIYINI
jgi:hypothetical protein